MHHSGAMASQAPATQASATTPILPPQAIFCPVGRALDVLGDRWTLVLLRHLLGGPRGFQELRARCGIAPRVLSARLRKLTAEGFVRRAAGRPRPLYEASERGRSLEPVITAIARWYMRHGLTELRVDPSRFSGTSAQSILESLPFMLREERAADVDLVFEIRLSGVGGGVWSVRIEDGKCAVRRGFAGRADVRYTADAHIWCAVALGLEDARAVFRQGLMTKDGAREAMDYYFYQFPGGRAEAAGASRKERRRKTR
jgi:DNA-binding HxlR family transcriptional regulator